MTFRSLAISSAPLAAVLALAACATGPTPPTKPEMMVAAGFKLKLADTPTKLSALKVLPQHKFIHRDVNGKTLTVWADLAGCKCLYVGGPKAWETYQQNAFAQHIIAEDQQATAVNHETAMMDYDTAVIQDGAWGAWGDETWAP